MNQTTLSIITPVINLIIGLVVAWIGGVIVKLAPSIFKLIEAKIGLTNYTKLKSVASDIFGQVEEDGRLGKLVNSKIDTFANLLIKEFPTIAPATIDTLRQSIASEFNKDKPIVEKAIEQTITVATPIIKYYATDGVTELAPVAQPLQ